MEKKIKWFAFIVWDSGVNQIGQKSFHWEVTSKFSTKKEVMEAYNPGMGYARKVKEVYTLRQLIERFGIKGAQRILESNRHSIEAESEQNKAQGL